MNSNDSSRIALKITLAEIECATHELEETIRLLYNRVKIFQDQAQVLRTAIRKLG